MAYNPYDPTNVEGIFEAPATRDPQDHPGGTLFWPPTPPYAPTVATGPWPAPPPWPPQMPPIAPPSPPRKAPGFLRRAILGGIGGFGGAKAGLQAAKSAAQMGAGAAKFYAGAGMSAAQAAAQTGLHAAQMGAGAGPRATTGTRGAAQMIPGVPTGLRQQLSEFPMMPQAPQLPWIPEGLQPHLQQFPGGLGAAQSAAQLMPGMAPKNPFPADPREFLRWLSTQSSAQPGIPPSDIY